MKTICLAYAANNPRLPHFPEGPLSLGGALREAGFKATLLDAALVSPTQWHFDDPLFLGISVYTNESIRTGIELAQSFRSAHPAVPIIWGGPHAQLAPDETARHPLADCVCPGEGERAIVRLAEQLSQGQSDFGAIPGLVFKNGDDIVHTIQEDPLPPEAFPWPDYTLIEHDRYFLARRKFYYLSSRGCPCRCVFCNIRHNNQRWRAKPAERVLEEISRIVATFQPEEFYISDANFFPSLDRVRKICEGILERGFTFRWTAFCRIDTIQRMPDELLKLLRQSGCYRLDIGGESGSDRILERLSKGITRDMILDSVERIWRADIMPELSFMTGLPFEHKEDTQATLTLAERLRKDFPGTTINGIFYYQPYPDTELGAQVIREWNLPIPKSLEAWARHPITLPRREYFPWLSRRLYQRMVTVSTIASYLHIYERITSEARRPGAKQSLLLRSMILGIRVLHHTVGRVAIWLRLEKGMDWFPVEWRLFAFLRNKILKAV